MKLSNKLRTIIFALTLVAHLVVPVVMFIHLSEMAEMNMPMEHCPFAFGEHQVCLMSSLEHISAWEKFSYTLLPSLGLLAVAVILFGFIVREYSPPFTRYLLYYKQKGKQRHSPYLQLFSQGILNTKLF